MKRTKTNDIPNFYFFRSRGYLATVQARSILFREAIDNHEYGLKRDIYDNMIVGQYEGYEFPIEFKQDKEYGSRLRDVLDTGYPPAYLISDRFRDLLTENNVTGWKTYPIRLYDKKGNPINGYNGLSFTGEGGDFDAWPEYNEDIPWYEKDRLTKKGIYNINNWDGSDIFMIRGAVLMTERVMKLIKKNKIDAVYFEKLSDKYDIIGTEEYMQKHRLCEYNEPVIR